MRLGDVADVEDSVIDVRNIGLLGNTADVAHGGGGKPSVLIIMFRQPGANVIETVDRVVALLPYLQSSISPAIKLTIAMDRTITVRP